MVRRKALIPSDATKENPLRSVAKAISWRVIASFTTFLIVFVIFRRYSEQSFNEVIQTATFITIIELFTKLIFYYLHERVWTNITWGKVWKRNYWQKKAWKNLYNKKHDDA